MIKFLQLLHWKSLLLLTLGLLLIKFTLFDPFSDITLNWVGMIYLCLAINAIAGAGFLLSELAMPGNSISTKPGTVKGYQTKKTGYRLFFILNIVGVLIGFYLSNLIGRPGFAVLFILASVLLYLKAYSFQRYILLRPLTTGILFTLSFILVWLFDLFPATTDHNQNVTSFLFSITLIYGGVIGGLVGIRELITNQLNMDRDNKHQIRSLSLALGKSRTNKVIFGLVILLIVAIIYFLLSYLYRNIISLLYVSLLIITPLFIVLYKILEASRKKDYILILKIMDGILICSVLSIALYQLQYILKA